MFWFLQLLPFALATEWEDKHDTKIHISEVAPHSINHTDYEASHILVSIDRYDKLYQKEEETEEMVGYRRQHIVVSIAVSPKGQVTLNKEPVTMGKSKMNLRVQTFSAIPAHNSTEAKEIGTHFDDGVLGVEVDVAGTQVMHDHMQVRRFVVIVSLMELNGEELSITQKVEKMLELRPDGLFSAAPCMARSSAKDSLHRSCRMRTHFPYKHAAPQMKSTLPHKAIKWYQHQPAWSRVLFCLALSMFTLSAVSAVISFIAMIVRYMTGYSAVPMDVSEKKELPFVEEKGELLPKYEQ